MLKRAALLIILVAVFASPVTTNTCSAQNDTIGAETTFDNLPDNLKERLIVQYEAQLNAVLKTRRAEEKKFVEEVVNLVVEKKLPKKLVDSSWLWIRSKRPYTNYPFVYFERILRLQAEKLEIDLPEFDREVYSIPQFVPQIRQSFRQPGVRRK